MQKWLRKKCINKSFKKEKGVPIVAQWLTNPRNHEASGSIPDLTQWVKAPKLLWLLCMAGSYSSDWTTSLGTSICRGCGPRKDGKTKKKNKKERKKEKERERERERKKERKKEKRKRKFLSGTVDYRSSVATTAAWVWSLAQELCYVLDAAKINTYFLNIIFS